MAKLNKFLLGLIPLTIVLPFASAATDMSGAFRVITDVLNEVARFIVSQDSISGINTTDIWKPVFIAIFVVFAIVFGATAYVKIFKEHRGARIVIALALAIAAADFGAVKLIYTFGGIGTIIAAMCALVFLILTMTRSFGRGSAQARAESLEAAKDVSRNEADYYREEKEKRLAEKELNDQDKLIKNERSAINDTEKQIKKLRKESIVDINDLKKLQAVIVHLTSVQDAGTALKLKEAYGREIAAMSMLAMHKEQRIRTIRDRLIKVESLRLSEIKDDMAEKRLISDLQARVRAGAPKGKADPVRLNEAAALANKIAVLNEDKRRIQGAIAQKITEFEAIEKDCIQNVQVVIENLHNNQYPPALTAINKAIYDEESSQKVAAELELLFNKESNDLDRRYTSIDAQIKKLVKP